MRAKPLLKVANMFHRFTLKIEVSIEFAMNIRRSIGDINVFLDLDPETVIKIDRYVIRGRGSFGNLVEIDVKAWFYISLSCPTCWIQITRPRCKVTCIVRFFLGKIFSISIRQALKDASWYIFLHLCPRCIWVFLLLCT